MGVGTKPGWLEVAVTTSAWFSSGAPAPIPLKLTTCGPAPWFKVRLLIGLSVGASLTARTVTKNELLTLALFPSVTVRVIVAVPERSGSGVTVRVRLFPLPPRTRLLVGMSEGLDDATARERLLAGVSVSLIVKNRGPVLPSSSIT